MIKCSNINFDLYKIISVRRLSLFYYDNLNNQKEN